MEIKLLKSLGCSLVVDTLPSMDSIPSTKKEANGQLDIKIKRKLKHS